MTSSSGRSIGVLYKSSTSPLQVLSNSYLIPIGVPAANSLPCWCVFPLLVGLCYSTPAASSQGKRRPEGGRRENNKKPGSLHYSATSWRKLRIPMLENKRCHPTDLPYNCRQIVQNGYWKYNRWRPSTQADYGGNAVNATQKYELIRPALSTNMLDIFAHPDVRKHHFIRKIPAKSAL